MRKIINNKQYFTDTAQRLAIAESPVGRSDHSFFEEALYRKRTGEYFLHGGGGGRSKYAKSLGQNQWGWGEEIIPLEEESARDWAQKNLSGEAYEEIFGEVKEDEIRVDFTIKTDVYEKLSARAKERGLSVAELLVQMVEGL